MKAFILKWLANAVAIAIVVRLFPGIECDSVVSLLLTSLFLGFIGPVVRTILIIFTLPLFIMTLGLLYFVINGLVLYFASGLIPGFSVSSFWTALLASLVISIVVSVINFLIADDKRERIIIRRE
jgi:putative membrane protein